MRWHSLPNARIHVLFISLPSRSLPCFDAIATTPLKYRNSEGRPACHNLQQQRSATNSSRAGQEFGHVVETTSPPSEISSFPQVGDVRAPSHLPPTSLNRVCIEFSLTPLPHIPAPPHLSLPCHHTQTLT